jgi:hypothetical protein
LGKGKSGVNLRWHPIKEYKSLNDAQKDKLKSWRNINEGKASIAASKKQYLDKRTTQVVVVVVEVVAVINVSNTVVTIVTFHKR